MQLTVPRQRTLGTRGPAQPEDRLPGGRYAWPVFSVPESQPWPPLSSNYGLERPGPLEWLLCVFAWAVCIFPG